MRFFTFTIVFFLNLYVSFSQDQSIETHEENNSQLNAIVDKESLSIQFDKSEITTDYRLVVKVLDPKGEDAVNTYVHYNKHIKIKNIEALIYDAKGELIKKVKKRDFNDVSAVSGGTLYSDSRVKYLNYSSNTYPYTIDFSYQTENSNTAFLPRFTFMKSYNTRVNYAELYVGYPEGENPVNYKIKNDVDSAVKFKQYPDGVLFTVKDLEPIKREVMSPSITNISPVVLLAPQEFKWYDYEGKAKNWDELGAWMHDKILSGKNNLKSATINEIKSITEAVESPVEKAKLVYEYVQDNTRYISVQVGIGGIQPIDAAEVDRMKYGDCKGLTNYTKALLDAVGIPSYYSHVESGRYKVDFEDDFSSINQGDHVILNIPIDEKDYWVDCTSNTSPFGFLGSFTDDRKVLVMTPNGGELKRTKSYLNEDNLTQSTSTVNLNEDNSFSLSNEIISKGVHFGKRLAYAFMPAYELEKKDKQRWNLFSDYEVVSHKVTNHKDSLFLYEEVKLKGNKFGKKLGKRIIFSPNVNIRDSYVPPRVRQRENPFQILRGYALIDTVKVKIPTGYTIEAFSEDKNFKSPFGTYHLEITSDKDFVIFHRNILIKEGLYSKDNYLEYREFRKNIAEAENSKISIIKS
ncbi:DUF3857 domain-containing transglutaminase family protein [Mesonia sp. MT50]|uniref:DUF3857 domain-containing transglutaminase family protein n=1 Tax=Mesonia profundi TaxID=3070998 RepID=A0ABU1A6D9_9FLAO|nr:DUF3857 domain-containing transglutaminase family protein [Mesonia profundi]MDQ7918521.1 DUF3857 domain-containing transglutaminase family protein [Mesonia profundi]